MPAPIVTAPPSASILAIMYFGDVVFAVSGALTAARYRMDVLGFVLIGTITGIGGGTTRDLLLGRTVWWTENPSELILCIAASLVTFFFITSDITRRKGMIWSDALGLAAFGVVGCHIALDFGAPFVIAVFMGMVTATGGGVIRDVLTNTQPIILCGQFYATAALLGSLSYASLRYFGVNEIASEAVAFTAAFALRASAIVFDIRTGPRANSFASAGDRPIPMTFRLRRRMPPPTTDTILDTTTFKRRKTTMAIELIEDFDNRLLTVKISGKLTAEDYELLEPGVETLIEKSAKVNILFVMHDFHGWDLGAVWEDIKFATKHCSDIHKIAMVGESTWEKLMATICKPFTKSSIKYFEAGDEAAARQWLLSE